MAVPEVNTEFNSSMVGKRQKQKEDLKAISYDNRKLFLNVSEILQQ